MIKNFIKPETKLKLQSVASQLYKKYGVEVINFTNFRPLISSENDKLEQPMSYHTMAKYQNYLSKIITNLEASARKEEIRKRIEEKKAQAVVEPSKQDKEIDFMIVVYKDGSIERKSPKVKEQEEQNPIIFIGLFDYIDNETIKVRRGTKTGCNVKSIESILAYFTTLNAFRDWCFDRLQDVASKRIVPNSDTPRDIETLKSIILKLEKRISDNL